MSALVCVALGCLIGPVATGGLALAATVAGLGLLTWWAVAGRGRLWPLPILLGLLAVAWSWSRTGGDDASLELRRLAPDGAIVRVEGVLKAGFTQLPPPVDPMDAALTRGDRFAGDLDLRAVLTRGGPVPADGTLRVWSDAAVPARAGQAVRVTGVYRAPTRPMNPGEPDRRRWAAQENEVGSLSIDGPGTLEVLNETGGVASLLGRARAGARERAMRALRGGAAAPTPGRALLLALVLGEEDPALEPASEAFRRAGVAHLLAISGFHLSAVAVGIALLVRATGDRGRVELGIVAAGVIAYLWVLPVEAPIARAGAMALTVLLASAAGRRYDLTAVLGWTGVAMLAWRPLDAGSLGFQLSFGITALLLAIARPADEGARRRLLRDSIDREHRARRLSTRLRRRATDAAGRFLGTPFAVATACWLVAAPVIWARTGTLSPVGPTATIALTPLVLALLAGGLAAAALGGASPDVGEAVADRLEPLGDALARAAGALEALPGGTLSVPPMPLWWAALATLAATLLVWVARRWRAFPFTGRPWQPIALAAVLAGGAALAGGLAVGTARALSAPPARLDTFAVGDGAVHLLRTPGHATLWDCGSLRPAIYPRVVERGLRELGVSGIDAVVISHANLDHYSGLPDALRAHRPGVLITTAALIETIESTDAVSAAVRGAIAESGVRVRTVAQGDRFQLGSAEAWVLWPPRNPPPDLSTNDLSMVAIVTVPTGAGPRTLMFTGDAEAAALAGVRAYLEANGGPPRVDVIEVPHHGSAEPEAMRFVQWLDPAVCVQSTGPSRVDDPRWADARAGRRWLTTAGDGAVAVIFGRTGEVRVSAFAER